MPNNTTNIIRFESRNIATVAADDVVASDAHRPFASRTVCTFAVGVPAFFLKENSRFFNKIVRRRVFRKLLFNFANLFYKSGVFLLQCFYFFFSKLQRVLQE